MTDERRQDWSRRFDPNGGSAAVQCGEALPHRYRDVVDKEAGPPPVEAQPRRKSITPTRPERQSLSTLRGGKAARRPTARRKLLAFFFLLLAAFCLLPSEMAPSVTVGFLTIAFSQNQPPQPELSPTPTPTPLPVASPTPPPNLHQWGALTLFHGLPSDRVHAIAQTPDGLMWFATDGGLAKYDGRRTQAITADGLPAGRVLALKVDVDGALWIGTENGAARLTEGQLIFVKETEGKVITAIISPSRGRALMASENGVIFDCQLNQNNTLITRTIPNQPLQSTDKDQPDLLKITSLARIGETLYAGTQGRGILAIQNGEATEVASKPRNFFINALETDSKGRLWVGSKVRADESGLLDGSEPLKPIKASVATGPVTAITRGADNDLWVASDGDGAFHLSGGKQIGRFTFEGTGGAMRSDHVFAIFVDREEVIWFGTDKGVCRYDPHAMRAENISGDASTNYVRALWRTSRGQLLAGTNSGLFAYAEATKVWRMIPEIGRRTVFAISEEKSGRVLVATANGLFAQPPSQTTFNRILRADERLTVADNARAIAEVAGVTYVAVFGLGVDKLEGGQRTLVWPDAAGDDRQREITSLGADPEGHLLIGTASAGIFLFDGKRTMQLEALDKLKGDAVWSIHDEEGLLWIGTGHGLYSFQSGELKELSGGANVRDVAISADNAQAKQVWCASVGNGLLKVALDDQFGPIVSRMDVEQGLPSQRVFAVLPERAADGTENVIVGTNRGIARYQVGRTIPTLYATRIISKRVHQPSELASGLYLDYPQNSLLVELAATSSRTFPEQFQYAFVLYDSSGHAIKQKLSHDAQFPMEGLKAGKYKVVARAFTKDLVASRPLSFEFSVARAPFPWTSTALAVLLLLALIALGWGYFQNRRINRTSAELALANRELADARLQLANETEAERRRIARDLHDQTLADLRNLALLVDQLPASRDVPLNRAPSAPGALRSEIESISQEVRRICEDLSPSALENVGLAAALQFALAHAVEGVPPAARFTYEFVCDEGLDEKLRISSSAQIQIYRIAQEALSNISRHAHAKRVKMTIAVPAGNAFELRIEDDGVGFDGGDVKRKAGRGVTNIRARANMIDAQASWARREGGGTEFSLRKS